MVEQVSVFLENTSGRLAQLARALGNAGIDMHALMVADTSEFGVVRIICDAPSRAEEVLEDSGFGVSITPVIAVEVPDRPGGLADVLEILDRAGMNVEYAYCFVKPSGEGAIDVLKIDAPDAEDALTAAGFRVLVPEDLYIAE
jgi:hypothetical protein